MKKGLSYSILKKFCDVRNLSSSLKGKENPITPRAQFIIDTILDLKIFKGLNLDTFEDEFCIGNLNYVNIELSFNNNSEKSVIFIAHHDVNNFKSQNCQDNSASVSNLLSLAQIVSKRKNDKNIHFVFTDCEEFGGAGAKRLSERIKDGIFGDVEYVVNLELTANGQELWCDASNLLKAEKEESKLLKKIKEINSEITEVPTPFNDSIILRGRDIDSICIGSLTTQEMNDVNEKHYCKTWALCHKENDFFSNAVSEDMDNFIEFLTKLL